MTLKHVDDVQKRTIWQSFAVLPSQTRLKISLAITAVAIAGIYISDQLEAALPPSPAARPPVTKSEVKEA